MYHSPDTVDSRVQVICKYGVTTKPFKQRSVVLQLISEAIIIETANVILRPFLAYTA